MALSTRQVIRQAIGRDNGWLIALGSCSSDGGAGGVSLTDNTLLYSTVRNQFIKARDIAASVQSGDATRGQRRWITGPPSSAGVVAVSPSFSAQINTNDDYEIWEGNGPHPDEIDRCIDKALAEACWYWRLFPVNAIRAGDGEEDLAVSGLNLEDVDGNVLWAGTSVTPSQETLEYSEEYIRRVIRILTTGANGNLLSYPFWVDPVNERSWRVSAFVRALGGSPLAGGSPSTGDARIILYDNTGSVDIVATTDPLQSLTRGWTLLQSNFIIPNDCHELAVKLQVQGNSEYGEFAAIQVWNRDRTAFSLDKRFSSKDKIGSLVVLSGDQFYQLGRREWGGTLERREMAGRGVSLEIAPAIGENLLWAYEKTSFPSLTSSTPTATDDDNETWAALEWVKTAASFYCYEYLKKRDNHIAPDRWRDELRDARELLEVIQNDYGIEPMYAEDSPRRSRRAIRRI